MRPNLYKTFTYNGICPLEKKKVSVEIYCQKIYQCGTMDATLLAEDYTRNRCEAGKCLARKKYYEREERGRPLRISWLHSRFLLPHF